MSDASKRAPGAAGTGQKRAKKRKPRESFGMVDVLPSGRVRARYHGPDGIRYSAPRTFDTLTDARGWLAGRRVEIDNGTWAAHKAQSEATATKTRTITFAEYAEHWIATRTRKGEPLRPRTAAEYRRLVGGPLSQFADARLVGISPEAVRVWFSSLVEAGTKTQAARAYELMKSILTTAVEDGRLTVNPCQIKGAASASTGRKVEPPTAAELQTILDTISPQYRAAVVIAAWGGLRYGELTELRRKDVEVMTDADETVIAVKVSRAVTKITGTGFVIGRTKSEAGVRTVVLPPHVNGIVEKHLRDYCSRFPESLLFPAADGVTHLSQTSFYKHWTKARAAAGRSDMPWHALRHYGATRAALAGATLRELQERLGHSTVSAAMRYQHTAGRDAELAKRMSELA